MASALSMMNGGEPPVVKTVAGVGNVKPNAYCNGTPLAFKNEY